MFGLIKNIGSTELVFVVVILIIIFGSKMVARFGKTSGEIFKEIKKVKKEFNKTIGNDDESSKN